MATETETRIDEISQRLAEYHQHENDPYAYDIDEIDAVRNFKVHAAEDMAFLLSLKNPEVKIEVKCESETATSHGPAKVSVFKNGELVAEVKAELRLGTGADGDSYYCIILKQVEIEKVDILQYLPKSELNSPPSSYRPASMREFMLPDRETSTKSKRDKDLKDASTSGTSGYFTVSDNPQPDEVKTFYDPHPGFGGAAIPLPTAVKRVADELAGEKMPLSKAIDLVQSVTSGKVSVKDGWIGLELREHKGTVIHSFRVIRFC